MSKVIFFLCQQCLPLINSIIKIENPFKRSKTNLQAKNIYIYRRQSYMFVYLCNFICSEFDWVHARDMQIIAIKGNIILSTYVHTQPCFIGGVLECIPLYYKLDGDSLMIY